MHHPAIPLLPEHLPGEPPLPHWTPLNASLVIIGKAFMVGVLLHLCAPLWVLYGLLRLAGQKRPPHVPSFSRTQYCFIMLLTESLEPPGMPWYGRVALFLNALREVVILPVRGLAWMLDSFLYGKALEAVRIEAPLIELSAARSGSTQLAHYLEDDPAICAPNLLQMMFPYLWLWKLVPATLGRVVSRDTVQRLLAAALPEPYVQRHELEAFRTDTFEIPYHMRFQLGEFLAVLGPRLLHAEHVAGGLQPSTQLLWETDFLDFFDAIGRKTLLYYNPDPTVPARRLMIKGHFLVVASQLLARYPDARFLTVLRAPDKRLQSIINFLRCHPSESLCGPTPWTWLVKHALEAEPEYCEREQAWFSQQDGAHRCIVRFDDYVKDLEGTMRQVYREYLGREDLPPHVPRTHAPRVRTQYAIDRSLEQLGVDVGWLKSRLAPYYAWCRGRLGKETNVP